MKTLKPNISNHHARPRAVLYMKDGATSPSSYYRLLQYRPAISSVLGTPTVRVLIPPKISKLRQVIQAESRGTVIDTAIKTAYSLCGVISATWYFAVDSSRGVDCLIIQRSLLPKTFHFPLSAQYRRLVAKANRTVWDFDDDILTSGELSQAEHLLLTRESDVIVLTNSALRDTLIPASRIRARILPTTDGTLADVDTRAAEPYRRRTYEDRLNVIWLGSAATLFYLENIVGAIDLAAVEIHARYHKDLVLTVVADVPLTYQFAHAKLRNVRWSRSSAYAELMRAHVGIMPLEDSQFARGKGGFKLIQYMSAGLPSLASPVGVNTEIVREGRTGYFATSNDAKSWTSAMVLIAADWSRWSSLSQKAREYWEQNFSFAASEKAWITYVSG